MKFTIGFRAVKHEDLDFLLMLRKKSMTKHLVAAKINTKARRYEDGMDIWVFKAYN